MNLPKYFLTSGSYISIPNTKKPRVILAVQHQHIARNSFELFQPFSKQGKSLKLCLKFLFCNFNSISKKIYKEDYIEPSDFISYLENKLNKSIVPSLYMATAEDKVVLQLQTPEAHLIGYLKFPLSELGTSRLKTEKKAIDILSSKGIIPNYLLFNHYESKPFLLLPPILGSSKIIIRNDLNILLKRFNRKVSFPLSEHPRILEIINQLKHHHLNQFIPIIKDINHSSKTKYSLVYEHGDFAPWNIITNQNSSIPFDFEYFIEDGLEHLDLIKYYYQIGKLLYKKDGLALLEYLQKNINLPEAIQLIRVFLIKEILQCHTEGKHYHTEVNILNLYN